jgi:putative addiction module component (TIGR02574 family)
MGEHTFDLRSVRKMSVAERLELVGEIWDSIVAEDAADAIPISDELAAELDRREAASRTSPDEGVTWDDLQRRLRSDPDDGPP